MDCCFLITSSVVKGQKFILHYDFGDDWVFVINVQKIGDSERKKAPKLIKSKGQVEQYPDWDEDWEEWGEEDGDEE